MRNLKRQLLTGPYLLWMAGFILLPVVMILYYAFTTTSGHFTLLNITSISASIHMKALLLSLKLALICTGICLILAYPLAMILNKMKIRRQGFIVFIFILPMWMNFMLRILAWRMLLSNNGVINTFLSSLHLPPLDILNTPFAVVFCMVYDFLPFMILPIYTTISKLDDALLEAARDLGAGNIQAFLKVTLPLSMPGIVSGVSMVFLPAMTNYVVLDMLYNSTYIMGSLIGSYFAAYNWHGGSMIALILLGIVCLFTLFTRGIEEENTRGGMLL